MPTNRVLIEQKIRVKIKKPFEPNHILIYPGDEVVYEVKKDHGGTHLCIDRADVYGESHYYIPPDELQLQLFVAPYAEEGVFETWIGSGAKENPCDRGSIVPMGKEGGGRVGGGS